jgi:small subunit ribosomal protein S6
LKVPWYPGGCADAVLLPGRDRIAPRSAGARIHRVNRAGMPVYPLCLPYGRPKFSPKGGPMRQYELTVIFPLEEDQYKEGRERLLADLNDQGAEIEKTDETGDRDLAYEIKKRRRGRYVLFTLKLDPVKLQTLDRIFKLNNNLLKYLFVNIEE